MCAIHISAAQRMRLSAAVVVTTPQNVAIDDARRGAAMFRKVRHSIFTSHWYRAHTLFRNAR